MRNVVLTKVSTNSFNDSGFLKGCHLFVEDNVTHNIFFVSHEGIVVFNGQLQFVTTIPCSDQCDPFEPVSIDVLLDSNELCVVLSSGQVLTVDIETYTMCTACFLGEQCSSASWSPDQTSIAAVEDDRVVFYNRSFEPFAQWELSNNDEGKDALVTVGWGAAETQFQGSAGKAAREKKVVVSKTAYANDSHKPYIKWRADGLYVFVSFYEQQSAERRIAVFSRDGELMARLKNTESVEEVIAVRPGGNYIATTKITSEGGRTMVFYERNGEKRHEMVLHGAADDRRLIGMQWDVESSCMYVHFREDLYDQVEIWTVSNYDWRRQWSSRFDHRIALMQWDVERARQLCILCEDGTYVRLSFDLIPIVVGSTAAVSATDELRLTDFDQCPVPPPMCGLAVPLAGAIHALAFDGKRIGALSSDFSLHVYKKDSADENWILSKTCQLKNAEQIRFFSFLCWFHEDLVAVAHTDRNQIVKINSNSGEITVYRNCDRRIVWLGVNPTSNELIMASEDGRFELLDNTSQVHYLESITSADHYDVKFAQEHVLVRTPDFELFVDWKPISSSVTSYLVSSGICLYITLQHKLHLMSLVSREQLAKERAVELGSCLLVCSTAGTSITMQMPRGNLETIHPRPFVVRKIKRLIDDLKYIEALKEMKKHRIDMNMLVDYKPDVFLEHIKDFVDSAKDPDLINLLIAALSNNRSEWCNGTLISNKVNRIADTLAKQVLSLPRDRRMQMFVVALTALLKSTPQKIQEALRLIKDLTNEVPLEKRDAYTRKWLHHVGFFVKEAELFDAALSTYDLYLTAQVAEASNRDPKEYIPLLNELRKVEPEPYRKYRIDLVRNDWRGALRHLSLLDDKWEEAVTLIRDKQLYSSALVIYKDLPKYKDVCLLYAEVLELKAQWQEAAILYDKTDCKEKALRCIEMSRDVNQYLSRARALGITEEELKSTLNRMAVVLKNSGRFAEAAKALEIAEAPTVSICETYAKAGLWMNAVKCRRDVKDYSLLQDLLKQRAQSVLDDLAVKSEEVERYAKRLEVLRTVKEERITKIKEGVESGRDLEDIDVFSDAGSIMSVTSRRTTKSGMSRASTTATVRKRKQIDKKKQSLKEGGEYEDSALLLAIANYYKWINELIAELVQLLPALCSIDEWEIASLVQLSVERAICEATSRRHHIWPQKLHPQDLPGPLYALYTVDDVFAFPNEGGMPAIITIEPEMIAPTINTDIKWKLQVLEESKSHG